MESSKWLWTTLIVGAIFTFLLFIATLLIKLIASGLPDLAPWLIVIIGGIFVIWAMKIRPGDEDALDIFTKGAVIIGMLGVLKVMGMDWVNFVFANTPHVWVLGVGLLLLSEYFYMEYVSDLIK